MIPYLHDFLVVLAHQVLGGLLLVLQVDKELSLVQPDPPDNGLDSILVKASLRDISARKYQFD